MAAISAQQVPVPDVPVGRQPNEFDRRRIERALLDRKRYRYVKPLITEVADGYLIRSPCCSRTVDAEGGVIDIALLQYVAASGCWRLHRHDPVAQGWQVFDRFERLGDLLEVLMIDPMRLFWR